jgi:regulator of replication initiation timing
LKGHLAQSQAQESDMCAQMDKFRSQANTLSFENRKLQSRLNHRYQETHILLIENQSLRKQLHSTGQGAENETDEVDEAEAIPDTTQS